MRGTLATIPVAILGLTLAQASPGHGNDAPHGTSITESPASPRAVLYDQMNGDSTAGSSSQDFEEVNDSFDSEIADDFAVPDGERWSIEGVDVIGQYEDDSGPAESFNVNFYANSADDLPGTLIESRPASAYTHGASPIITLDSPVVLGYGTYWVSVQARMDFTPTGQWFWNDRITTSNHPSAFRNPGGDLSTCTEWDIKVICVPAGGPDMVFRLNGTIEETPLETGFCSGFEVGDDGSCD
jgi:hypothetical protein